jgi:D-alanine-D-alanine ligase
MRTVVAVLRGGPSSEYDVSLKTGASVLAALNKDAYEPRDIFISRGGAWHLHGVEMHPERALRGVDVAFNAMHGHYGEDGTVQHLLDNLGVAYTGSGAYPSAVAFDKHRTREAVAVFGVKIPHGTVLSADKISDLEATARNIFRSFPHPAIVKPVANGSSIGISAADNFHGLVWALENAFKHSNKVLIEEYIKGRDATVGVIDNFRNERTYTTIPVPSTFTDQEKQILANAARAVHEGLGLAHYSRSDFVVSPRGIYFLEVNTLPGLTTESLLPKALEAGGTKLSHFLDHIISLARGKSRHVHIS